MMYEVREISGSTLSKVLPLIRELRPHLDAESFERLYKEARLRDEYKLVGLVRDEICYALMGYRILFDFTHGKHLYIDDLVVTRDLRGAGLGAMLLNHAREQAEVLGCEGLRLCTGVDNKDAVRFYEREGWAPRALAFKIKLGGRS